MIKVDINYGKLVVGKTINMYLMMNTKLLCWYLQEFILPLY